MVKIEYLNSEADKHLQRLHDDEIYLSRWSRRFAVAGCITSAIALFMTASGNQSASIVLLIAFIFLAISTFIDARRSKIILELMRLTDDVYEQVLQSVCKIIERDSDGEYKATWEFGKFKLYKRKDKNGTNNNDQ